MSAILKFDFHKREQLRFSEVNYLNYIKKPNFACGNYILPKTMGNKNKPWTHSTPLNQSSPFFHHCKGKFMTSLEIDIFCSRFFLFLKYSSHLMIAFFLTHPVYKFIKDLFLVLSLFLFLFFQLNVLFHKLKLFMNHLRLRYLFVETDWVCHVWFNF